MTERGHPVSGFPAPKPIPAPPVAPKVKLVRLGFNLVNPNHITAITESEYGDPMCTIHTDKCSFTIPEPLSTVIKMLEEAGGVDIKVSNPKPQCTHVKVHIDCSYAYCEEYKDHDGDHYCAFGHNIND